MLGGVTEYQKGLRDNNYLGNFTIKYYNKQRVLPAHMPRHFQWNNNYHANGRPVKMPEEWPVRRNVRLRDEETKAYAFDAFTRITPANASPMKKRE